MVGADGETVLVRLVHRIGWEEERDGFELLVFVHDVLWALLSEPAIFIQVDRW